MNKEEMSETKAQRKAEGPKDNEGAIKPTIMPNMPGGMKVERIQHGQTMRHHDHTNDAKSNAVIRGVK